MKWYKYPTIEQITDTIFNKYQAIKDVKGLDDRDIGDWLTIAYFLSTHKAKKQRRRQHGNNSKL